MSTSCASGNSIGGGLCAGASATLGTLCQGVVLCNTAGVLLEHDDYERDYLAQGVCVRDTTLRGVSAKPYAPVPLLGPPALELFGGAIIAGLFPQIPKLLTSIYEDSPENADEALTVAITQGAESPGSANVIGSGQKLAENRPLNEVLSARHGFGGPVLVAQGLNDRVSGPSRAQQRADLFERMRDGAGVTDDSADAVTQAMLDWPVTVERIAGGHCVMDDSPDAVAQAMLEWLPDVRAYAAAATSGVLADTDSS